MTVCLFDLLGKHTLAFDAETLMEPLPELGGAHGFFIQKLDDPIHLAS
jgi:hypothetical protein